MLLESEFKTEGPKDNKGFDWRWVELQNDPPILHGQWSVK